MAEVYVRAGAHWIGLDFDGVEGTNGDLLPMADQVRRGWPGSTTTPRASAAIRSRIYVVGQSSGAHLAGSIVTTDWKDYGVPDDVVKGALLLFGHVRLEAGAAVEALRIRRVHRRSEEKLSSQRHLDRLNCPVVVAYGTYETPEFQRQNREFAAAVKAAGKPVTLLVGEGYNHFEMTEMIGNPLSLLGSAVLEQMKLA